MSLIRYRVASEELQEELANKRVVPDRKIGTEERTAGIVCFDNDCHVEWMTETMMADQPAYVDGVPQYEQVDTVKELKRAKLYDEALTLLNRIMDATERENAEIGFGVAPWCYEQAAIIDRKNGDRENEIAVLERFARQQHARGVAPAKLLERLRTLTNS